MLNKWPCGGTNIGNLSPSQSPPFKSTSNNPQNGLFHPTPLSPWLAKPISLRLLKRPRPDESNEGEGQEPQQRKKRRLRINLVTSRLSRPYADPATHIVGTKTWRAGAWARQRLLGGKLLRKAAIFNLMAMHRKEGPSEKARMREWLAGNATPRLHPGALNTKLSPDDSVSSTTPHLTSEYDAFDYEEEDVEQEEDDDTSDDDGHAIHSDFRLLESSDTDSDFFDTSWSFMNTGEPELNTSGDEIKLVMENERKIEVSVAPTRSRDFPP